jgi:regulator of RNase E activity RraB
MGIESEVREQRAATRQLWTAMVQNGAAEGDVLDVESFFFTPDEPAARSLADRLGESGASVEVEEGRRRFLRKSPWVVRASTTMAVSVHTVQDLTEKHVRLAHEVGATYDGWGALLPPAAG